MYAKPDSSKKRLVEELVYQNMQNHLVCFCLLVIPLNLTNCLNAMNILISKMPRDMNLKFSCFDLYVSDYAYR